MLQATHPPQPPTNRAEEGQTVSRLQSVGKVSRVPRLAMIEPLRGCTYAVGAKHSVQITNPEFGMNINQFDNHRNRFIAVIERVRFLDGDGVMTDRIILDVRGLIVQIVAHDDSPRTVIVKIGEDLR